MAKTAKRKRAKPAAKGTARKTATRKTAARTGASTAPKKKNTAKATPRTSPGEALDLYRRMLLIRRFEEKAGQLYGMGLISGFCHLYIGQEAVVVGMQAAAGANDTLVTSYRDHGHMLACGMDPKGVMAELTGRRGGYSKGKGGSMHMFSREANFFGGHGIVAAQVPIGTGLALGTSTIGTAAYAAPISATAPSTRDRSTSPSTWRPCGSCR